MPSVRDVIRARAPATTAHYHHRLGHHKDGSSKSLYSSSTVFSFDSVAVFYFFLFSFFFAFPTHKLLLFSSNVCIHSVDEKERRRKRVRGWWSVSPCAKITPAGCCRCCCCCCCFLCWMMSPTKVATKQRESCCRTKWQQRFSRPKTFLRGREEEEEERNRLMRSNYFGTHSTMHINDRAHNKTIVLNLWRGEWITHHLIFSFVWALFEIEEGGGESNSTVEEEEKKVVFLAPTTFISSLREIYWTGVL